MNRLFTRCYVMMGNMMSFAFFAPASTGLICASAKLSPSARMVQGHDDFDTVNDETLYITMAWMCIKPVISSPDHRHYEVTRSTCRSSFYHYKANGLCLSNLASSETE